MHSAITLWRDALARVLELYERRRGPVRAFFPKLFVFFVVVNIACYWWAMFTAFPELTVGEPGRHYFRVQFPVGFLGALFDTVSFFVTIWIIRRALASRGTTEYVAHLSLDLLIAIAATFWVVFVFIASGWAISLIEQRMQSFAERSARYNGMVVDAAADPLANIRNIYFGLVMGISSALPTALHLTLFVASTVRAAARRFVPAVRHEGSGA